jgi:beta-glucosidase
VVISTMATTTARTSQPVRRSDSVRKFTGATVANGYRDAVIDDGLQFPPGFQFGTATAAYQIEGAVAEDGRGPSIWDTFSHTPGAIRGGDTGDVACDSYHRYAEDIRLMSGLGVAAYRFSISWPRVLPAGSGAVNQAGLDHYKRLVDALRDAGIEPAPTLFHWDLPQALQESGGWLDRDTAARFADYAAVVAEGLGDRVGRWMTLNEPVVVTWNGFVEGSHAPGLRLGAGAFPVAHHQLLGHGLAVAALRARSASPVTIANSHSPVRVIGERDEDRAAAAIYDALQNRIFVEPLLGMGYPEGFDLPVRDGDLEAIAAPIDALGVNYYNPTGISAPSTEELPFDMVPLDGYPMTEFGWPVVPDGLRELLVDLHGRYHMPMYVTENGCAYAEWPADPHRVEYLSAHVEAVHEAIAQGADVRGYFAWSLLDNWEWAEGFTKRFGLVHVDFDTQQRTPKTSYAWYRDFIASTRS